MHVLKRIRKSLEAPFTRLGFVIIPPLSRRAVLRLARVLGAIGYRVSRRLRRVGMANLDVAYGDTLSPAQKRDILRQSYRTFALVVLDIFWFSHRMAERMGRYTTIDPSLDPFFRPARQVCLTGHFGNWELLGLAVTLKGLPMTSVAAPLANPAVDAIFMRARQQTAQRVVPRQGAVRELLRTLHNDGKVALLLDQNTRPEEGGAFVNFFGLPVPVSSAAASLALRVGAEIMFGFCAPNPDGSYRMYSPVILKPAPQPGESHAQAVQRVTQEIAGVFEQEIRANPGAWLWMYKRWKHVAPGRDPDEYPFYARC